MKILTIIVPCFNSQETMEKCIDSLLPGGEAVEIIIVDDGSADNTAAIAGRYESSFPQTVRVIRQENKGHGGAINSGLAAALGMFIKVVDSDDWVDAEAYRKILDVLRSFEGGKMPCAVIANYVYEKAGKRRKAAIRYGNVLPEGRICTWEETGRFRLGQYFLMHSLIYRRDILQGLRLPEHTFYVDNVYAYAPLANVETMYYLDADFYRYFIGREGQSVQEKTMIRRIDQQLAVNRLMAEAVNLHAIKSDKKRRYLAHYMEIVTVVSSVLLLREGSSESIEKKAALWQFIKTKDAALYARLRTGMFGRILHWPSRVCRSAALFVYRVSRLIVGFS